MGVNRKFDFRQTESSAGTSVMPFHVGIGSLGGTVFPGGTLYHSANYVIFIMVFWYRRPNSGTQKKTDIFFFRLFLQFKINKNLFLSKKIYRSYFKPF